MSAYFQHLHNSISWNRILACLGHEFFASLKPFGLGSDGRWFPSEVNACMRCCEYGPGGHFAPHRDGGFVIDDDYRSVLTLIVYLSDGFEGGMTVLHDADHQQHQVIPALGNGLLFNHDLRHEGWPVISGTKYILRTDVMFRRSTMGHSPLTYLRDPGRQHAEQLYRKSIQLQLEGDPLDSTSHYVQVMECAIGAVQSTAYELPSTPWPVCLPVTLANRVFRSLADAPQPSSFTMFFKDYGIGRAPRPGIYKIM